MPSLVDIALLENLTYFPDSEGTVTTLDTFYKQYKELHGTNPTVADYLNSLNLRDLPDEQRFEAMIYGRTIKSVVEAVRNNPELMNMEIAGTNLDVSVAQRGGGGHSAFFVDRGSKEAVFAFRGTAANEWVDNVEGAAFTDFEDGVSTYQQNNALAWYKTSYQNAGLNNGYKVTVAGHSKGGNKAKYIALMDETVDKCISFDGQGFSDEFIERYQDKIMNRQNVIENHNLNKDYVSAILNNVGKTFFYKGKNVPNFAANHCPYAFFDLNNPRNLSFDPDPRGRDRGVQGLHDLLNSYLRTIDNPDTGIKKKTVSVVSNLVKGVFDSLLDVKAKVKDPFAKLRNALTHPDTKEYASDFVGYALSYMSKVKNFLPALDRSLRSQGVKLPIGMINMVMSIPSSIASAAGTVFTPVIKSKLSKLNMSYSDTNKLVGVLKTAFERRDKYNERAERVLYGGEDQLEGSRISGVRLSDDVTAYLQIRDLHEELINSKTFFSSSKYKDLIKQTGKLVKLMSQTGDFFDKDTKKQILDEISETEGKIRDYMIHKLQHGINRKDEKKVAAADKLRTTLGNFSHYLVKEQTELTNVDRGPRSNDPHEKMLYELAILEVNTMTKEAINKNNQKINSKETSIIKDAYRKYLTEIMDNQAFRKAADKILRSKDFKKMSRETLENRLHETFIREYKTQRMQIKEPVEVKEAKVHHEEPII